MAVRDFASGDEIEFATGAASGMTFGTVAALLRYQVIGGGIYQGLAHFENSGGTFQWSGLAATPTDHWMMYSSVESAPTGTLSDNTWYLVVCRKATGSAAPRSSWYNLDTPGWTHQAHATAIVNGTAPGVSGFISTGFGSTGDRLQSALAAMAVWSNTLPWSADTTGDTAIEAAGLEDAAQNWLDESPSTFWLFNQASTATAVEDLSTTGTADQAALTGTSVLGGADPPGFDFALGGVAAPSLFVVRSNLSLR